MKIASSNKVVNKKRLGQNPALNRKNQWRFTVR